MNLVCPRCRRRAPLTSRSPHATPWLIEFWFECPVCPEISFSFNLQVRDMEFSGPERAANVVRDLADVLQRQMFDSGKRMIFSKDEVLEFGRLHSPPVAILLQGVDTSRNFAEWHFEAWRASMLDSSGVREPVRNIRCASGHTFTLHLFPIDMGRPRAWCWAGVGLCHCRVGVWTCQEVWVTFQPMPEAKRSEYGVAADFLIDNGFDPDAAPQLLLEAKAAPHLRRATRGIEPA